ncbi:MAG: nicotinate (nicotinamide) nucleotide adenylyltransferase [Acidimicrobiia bacterium]|nr:nicotinate (nicotinamide) nucleotide adenylyltransferase [Acidimicrobiia bacterium]
MLRIGVFGGTFDPVHNGHLAAAVNSRRALDLDRVLVVPARDPWQKQDRALAPAEARLAMLEAAMDGVAGIEISRIELDRPGTTYTADTVEELHVRFGEGAELFLIVGADAASDLAAWDRPEVMRDLTTIVIVSRADIPQPDAPGEAWRVEHVRIPPLAISSTDLRERVANGDPLDGLMPAAAIRCLRERGLYPGRG